MIGRQVRLEGCKIDRWGKEEKIVPGISGRESCVKRKRAPVPVRLLHYWYEFRIHLNYIRIDLQFKVCDISRYVKGVVANG